jgi:hypothetical protein
VTKKKEEAEAPAPEEFSITLSVPKDLLSSDPVQLRGLLGQAALEEAYRVQKAETP